MTRGLTFLFAIAAGTAVGNLYWAQPLLDFIAGDLHSPVHTAAWLVTATQLGYAVGILLIVPLGDVLNRRRLIPTMMLCAAAALVLCAVAPSMPFLIAAITLLGLTTVAGQILTPLAGDLADDENRGRVVGTVISGLLIGILTSRTISGLVAQFVGWRAIFALAAVLAVLFAGLLYRAIPPLSPKAAMPYPTLIGSVFTVIRREQTVRWTLVFGAAGFAVFTMFWTSLTFLLSGPPFNYPVSVIGLFGLAGLAGAIAAQRAGWLHDRGWSVPATGAAWAVALVGFLLAGVAGTSAIGLIVAIIVLDIALQAQNILNQTRIFTVSHEARSRLNTAFITSNFIGGAIGSAAAGVLWSAGGWATVTGAGAAISVAALFLWLLGRRGPLVVG